MYVLWEYHSSELCYLVLFLMHCNDILHNHIVLYCTGELLNFSNRSHNGLLTIAVA